MAIINGRGTWGVRAFMPTIISSDSNWTRPTDWLPLNAPTGSTEQFTALLAITDDDSNYVTLVATSAGNYTVDWGDGSITTHASGTIAQYKYEYSAISESTLCSRGYKQVVVKLTGTSISQLMTNRPHSALSGATNVLYTWLEYHINLPNCTFIQLNKSSYTNGAYQTWVEKVTINKLGNVSAFTYLFNLFYSLQEVVINATTTSVTDAQYMFNECYYLKSVPLFNTSNITNITNMFSNCYSLTAIPSFNFSAVTQGSQVFLSCHSLTSVPTLNFGNATSLYGLFNGCSNLTTIEGLTTTKCQEFSFMFTACISLETVPLFDTSKATSMGNMFSSCRSLTEIPAFNTSLVTQFGNTFLACINLKTIPSLDMSKAASLTQTFGGCVALDVLPPLNVNSSLNFSNVFSGTNGIAKAPFFNIRNTFSFTGQMLSRTAILDIFNGLVSGVVSKTITVSGNPGFTSLTTADRLIATAKGWTIA